MGLTICKYLAELMGGSVDFRSEEGAGTTFIFKLKLSCQSDKSLSLYDKAAAIDSPRKILLLEGKEHAQNAELEQYFKASDTPYDVVKSTSAWLSLLA